MYKYRKNKYAFILVGMMTLSGAAFIPVFASSWNIQSVEYWGNVGLQNSIAIDSLGRVHISYIENNYSTYNLKYAFWDGNTWQIQSVALVGDIPLGSSLVLDSNDLPRICYTYFKLGYQPILGYAKWNGSTWELWGIDYGASGSLSLDVYDRPHISYSNPYSVVINNILVSRSDLKYTYLNGQNWQTQTIEYGGRIGEESSLALDSQMHPHIAYKDFGVTSGQLKYAAWNGSAWQIQVVDNQQVNGNPEGTGKNPSLALDSIDRPHISYAGADYGLKYASYNGVTWQIQTVETSVATTALPNSLVLDQANRPHISYQNDAPSALKYAVWDGLAWQIEVVDALNTPSYNSLALDSGNRPHISYYELINGDLKYATIDVIAPVPRSLSLTQNQWHLISPLPLDGGGGGTVGEIVGNDVLAGNLDSAIYGNATANGWIMYQHNALTNLYETLTIDSPLTVGRGYWLKTLAANQSFTVSGNANSVTPIDLEAAPNPADGRSNMLGHPYDYNVCWNDAQISNDNFTTFETPTTADPGNICDTDPADPTCILSRKMYKWNGAAYQTFDGTTPGAEGVLEPFDGFFVKVFKPGYQLQIPATPSCQGVTAAAQATLARALKTTDGSDPESESTAKKVRNPDEWNIRLTVSAEGLTDPGNLIGRLNDSRDGHDAHDLDERPADFNPHLTLVFPHHDWGDHAGDYTTDYRALERNPTGVTDWDFEIRSDQLRTITLTWDIDNQDIRNHSRLIDVENNVKIKPKKVNHYTIPMVGTTHRFTWRMRAGR